MVAADGHAHPALIEELLENGPGFGFFEAVRLIQLMHPQAPPIGHQGPAREECLRLRPVLSLGFPPADIAQIERLEGEDGAPRYLIEETFHGLYGACSPLPVVYTEELFRDEEDIDGHSLVRGFLDIFHHRSLSLLYRVWEKYRVGASLAQGEGGFFNERFLALLHLERDKIPAAHRIPARRFLADAGLLIQQPHSADALECILRDHFPEIAIEVVPFTLSLIELPRSQHCALARSATTLGEDLVLGARVRDRSCRFRLRVGPLEWEELMGFLPGGDDLARLREVVDLCNSDHLDYEVELCPHPRALRGVRLGNSSTPLGWSSWLAPAGRAARPAAPVSSVIFPYCGWFHG